MNALADLARRLDSALSRAAATDVTAEAEAHDANRGYDVLTARLGRADAGRVMSYLIGQHVHNESCTDLGYGTCY